MCTASTTFVSVWGSGKALRGKDGSMDKAVDGMNDERAFIFTCFGALLAGGPAQPPSRCAASLMVRATVRLASVIRCGADHDAACAHVGRMDPDDARGRLRRDLRRLMEHMGHRAAGARATLRLGVSASGLPAR